MTTGLEAGPIADRASAKVHLPEKLNTAGRVGRTGVWIVLLLYGLFSVIPMIWLLIAPSKTATQLNNDHPFSFGTFANYGKIDPAVTWMKLAALREGADRASSKTAGKSAAVV